MDTTNKCIFINRLWRSIFKSYWIISESVRRIPFHIFWAPKNFSRWQNSFLTMEERNSLFFFCFESLSIEGSFLKLEIMVNVILGLLRLFCTYNFTLFCIPNSTLMKLNKLDFNKESWARLLNNTFLFNLPLRQSFQVSLRSVKFFPHCLTHKNILRYHCDFFNSDNKLYWKYMQRLYSKVWVSQCF